MTRLTTRLTNRDERGVTAIIFALCAVLLFSLGALVVDLGNAQQRHRDTQTEADFAALAGGAGNNLPGPQATPLASDPAVASVATYLLKNWTFSDGGSTPSLSVLEQNLTDSTGLTKPDTNGQVYYGHFTASGTLVHNLNQLTVVTPNARVDFGLANAMGYSHTNVAALATVEIRSPKIDELPFYAATGCDYGQQTISQPSNGTGGGSTTRYLAFGSDTNAAGMLALNPAQIALDDTKSNLVINGSNFTNVTQVGFFENGNQVQSGPPPVIVLSTGFTINSASKITVAAPLPAAVTSVQDTWYVRVYIAGAVNKWSDENTALPLTVGDPLLQCAQGSSDGNFGTIQLSNAEVKNPTAANDVIAANIIGPLDHSLAVFPKAHQGSPWTCTTAMSWTVVWPNDGTNCVDTKTGLPQGAATEGFITGVDILASPGHEAGRLDLNGGTGAGTGCNPDTGLPVTRIVNAGSPTKSYTINNDTLSCFLVDKTGSTNIGDIDSPNYNLSDPALTQQIYNSPRFFWVPVFGVVPVSGGSSKYQIVDFRPTFITDQPNSATYSTAATANNGITIKSNALQSVQVVFLNDNSVPPPPGGKTSPYVGTGPKFVQLID